MIVVLLGHRTHQHSHVASLGPSWLSPHWRHGQPPRLGRKICVFHGGLRPKFDKGQVFEGFQEGSSSSYLTTQPQPHQCYQLQLPPSRRPSRTLTLAPSMQPQPTPQAPAPTKPQAQLRPDSSLSPSHSAPAHAPGSQPLTQSLLPSSPSPCSHPAPAGPRAHATARRESLYQWIQK